MELVVLVDDNNNPIGTAPKETIHTLNTPLHRAFSLFVFNSNAQVLLTKRAKTKKTFPGVWTNSVCGHPGPRESVIEAAKRRLEKELGIISDTIAEVAPYRYRFADMNGIVENEICPILKTISNVDPRPDLTEVDEWKWVGWKDFLRDIENNSDIYSPWCKEEAVILQQKDQELQ